MCYIKVSHSSVIMDTINIRTLKHDTSAVLARVAQGESLEVRRRDEALAVLSPVRRECGKRPDFRKRLLSVYKNAHLETTATELIAEERGDR